MPMKILIVMNYRRNSGITVAIEERLKSLRREGFDVQLVSTHGRIRDRIKNIFYVLKTAPRHDLIMAVGCAYYGFLPIIVGVIAARAYKKSILVDFHDGYIQSFIKRFGRLIKLFLGDIPVTVASRYLLDTFKEYRINAVLITHHFHYESFPVREKPFDWNKRFVWVGAFIKDYDPETALRAAELVLEKKEDIMFHFFGEGPLLEEMKRKYPHKNIEFRGMIPHGELLREYQHFSVLINSSLSDNFPLRLVEAAYNELLVITTNYGGVPTVYDEKECVLYDRKDHKRLSEHVLAIINDPHSYDALRKNMCSKVRSFTWGGVRGKWASLLEK